MSNQGGLLYIALFFLLSCSKIIFKHSIVSKSEVICGCSPREAKGLPNMNTSLQVSWCWFVCFVKMCVWRESNILTDNSNKSKKTILNTKESCLKTSLTLAELNYDEHKSPRKWVSPLATGSGLPLIRLSVHIPHSTHWAPHTHLRALVLKDMTPLLCAKILN